jgi:hypothetical protein
VKQEILLSMYRVITMLNVFGESGVLFNGIASGNIIPST